uniref:Uncharacterized protein n=1 Tax=Pipistrellus kuhlii TaxID=59472 RepID=A0A7J7X0F5_PIPKU|nr:hypothetical protein mPipKuh1_010777 [Pipistrellus kuhlii]
MTFSALPSGLVNLTQECKIKSSSLQQLPGWERPGPEQPGPEQPGWVRPGLEQQQPSPEQLGRERQWPDPEQLVVERTRAAEARPGAARPGTAHSSPAPPPWLPLRHGWKLLQELEGLLNQVMKA